MVSNMLKASTMWVMLTRRVVPSIARDVVNHVREQKSVTATPISSLRPPPESSTTTDRSSFFAITKGTLYRTNTDENAYRTSAQTDSGLSIVVDAGTSILSDPLVNLLSLDGGGIHGVSELFILDEIMKRIQARKNLPNTSKPCDYFDLIGGTSTGGLIAIMLGRLKITAEEALQSYNKISSVVFSAKNRKPFYRDGKFKATTLKKEIQNVVRQVGHSNDQKLLDPDAGPNSKGNVFVCSMTGTNLRSPQRFRTYQGLPNQGEAKELFGPNRCIGVLVSIGTGHPGPSVFQQPKGIEKVLPLELIRVFQGITTDCESVTDELAKEYGGEDTHFSFNVLHGAEGVSLDEWKKMSEVMAHTSSYLRGPEISREIDRVVAYLCSSLPQIK
ncbi:acyl transferase/acyl hydrolase/lysophospholipase [Armillaria nabsnona]|nr:acyl transferase/acyl hydrolase/lysophospholipase [Armillaria nabsnona]